VRLAAEVVAAGEAADPVCTPATEEPIAGARSAHLAARRGAGRDDGCRGLEGEQQGEGRHWTPDGAAHAPVIDSGMASLTASGLRGRSDERKLLCPRQRLDARLFPAGGAVVGVLARPGQLDR